MAALPAAAAASRSQALPVVSYPELQAHWQQYSRPVAAALPPPHQVDLVTLAARWQLQLLPGHPVAIPGDGNCLLSSVCWHLYHGPDGKTIWPGVQGNWIAVRHILVAQLRVRMCDWLIANEHLALPFGPLTLLRHNSQEQWAHMVARFRQAGEYLEAPAIQALACRFGYDISLLVDSIQSGYTFYANATAGTLAPGGRMLLLANWALSHFVPLVPHWDAAQLPSAEQDSSAVDAAQQAGVSDSNQPAALQRLCAVLDEWIRAYYVEWDQPGIDTPDRIRSAQQDAVDTLRVARLRLDTVHEGIRLMVIGAMRAGKSTLLSALVGGAEPLFPAFAANESCSMVPVEIGAAASDRAACFTVLVQMSSLGAWQERQRNLAEALFAQWQVDIITPGDASMVIDTATAAAPAPSAVDADGNAPMDEFSSFEAALMQDLSSCDAAMAPTGANEPAEQPRTLQQNQDAWICASRTAYTDIENHPLKSLYAALDLSANTPNQATLQVAASLLTSVSAAPGVAAVHPSHSLVDELLRTADGHARFFEFRLRDLADVHLLLFLLSVDHANAELQAMLHGGRSDAERLLSNLAACDPSQMAGLAPILRFLVPDKLDAVADLWPIVEHIDVNCPWFIWPAPLPKRLRVIDTAGLRAVRTRDGEAAVNKAQLAQLRINRVWYAGVSSASGGGDMMPAVEAMLRSLAEINVPVDVIVTRSDEARLALDARKRKEEAIKDKIAELQPRIIKAGAHPGECFHVEAPKSGPHVGIDLLRLHLASVETAAITAARRALIEALIKRAALLQVGGGSAKLNAQEEQGLMQQLDQLCEQSRGTIEMQPDWNQRGQEVLKLQHSIREAANPAASIVTTTALQFSNGCLKSHDYRHLGAWVRHPWGSGTPSLSELILDTYFTKYSPLSSALDPFLTDASNNLATDQHALASHVLADITTLLQTRLADHPMLQSLVSVLQMKHVADNIQWQLSQALYVATQNLEEHVREVSAGAAAALEQHLEQVIVRGAAGSLPGWLYTFSISGIGIKNKLITHVRDYLTGPLAGELLRQCGEGFHQHVTSLASHVATARSQMLEIVYRHVKQTLAAVWQPLSAARNLQAKNDLMKIFNSFKQNQLLNKNELHFVQAQLLKPFQPPPQAARAPVSLARVVPWRWQMELVQVHVRADAAATDRFLLFRGLCGLSAAVRGQFNPASVNGPFSPLFVAPEHMYCAEWDHLSALVVILHAYRRARLLPRPLQSPQLMESMLSPDGRLAMQQLGEQIRQRMLTYCTGATAAAPPLSHPNDDFSGDQWVNWWTDSRPKEQHFAQLQLALQQTYTNDDKGFFKQFQDCLTEINLGDASLQRRLTHRRNWKVAAKLTAWLWSRDVLTREEMQALAQHHALHLNPNVSLSKRLQHAMRYSVGLKKYAQGTTPGESPPLDYGRRAAPQGARALYINPDLPGEVQSCYCSPRAGQLLGSIVVYAVPAAELEGAFTVDVIRKFEEGALWPDSHARHESEVCQFGFIDRQWRVLRHDLLLLDWNDTAMQQLHTGAYSQPIIAAYAAYGFTPANVATAVKRGELDKLRRLLRECVGASAAAALSQRYSTAEVPVREYLGTLAFAAMHASLITAVDVQPGSTFPLEEVIKGTAGS